MSHKRPDSAKQQNCTMCKAPAFHKVGEEVLDDIELVWEHPKEKWRTTLPRHNWTSYVCCTDFCEIMGFKDCSKMYRSEEE